MRRTPGEMATNTSTGRVPKGFSLHSFETEARSQARARSAAVQAALLRQSVRQRRDAGPRLAGLPPVPVAPGLVESAGTPPRPRSAHQPRAALRTTDRSRRRVQEGLMCVSLPGRAPAVGQPRAPVAPPHLVGHGAAAFALRRFEQDAHVAVGIAERRALVGAALGGHAGGETPVL